MDDGGLPSSIFQANVVGNPIIVDAKIAGYLIRMIYVEGGAAIEIMYESCFKSLHPFIQAKLQTTSLYGMVLLGIFYLLEEITLDVTIGCYSTVKSVFMKFIVVRALTKYSVPWGGPYSKT
ncbi:reverse transcriptase domain-containing protein [Artemisia annua]|uniref:Reverse transcriptase domain-containing protein n=1 Tax=Artemisia annua TaxID=35608 RepID=A0A2U1L9S1_ARTAN|nr:reverse transcriptase domain-containing protein [Artemisia annua]